LADQETLAAARPERRPAAAARRRHFDQSVETRRHSGPCPHAPRSGTSLAALFALGGALPGQSPALVIATAIRPARAHSQAIRTPSMNRLPSPLSRSPLRVRSRADVRSWLEADSVSAARRSTLTMLVAT